MENVTLLEAMEIIENSLTESELYSLYDYVSSDEYISETTGANGLYKSMKSNQKAKYKKQLKSIKQYIKSGEYDKAEKAIADAKKSINEFRKEVNAIKTDSADDLLSGWDFILVASLIAGGILTALEYTLPAMPAFLAKIVKPFVKYPGLGALPVASYMASIKNNGIHETDNFNKGQILSMLEWQEACLDSLLKDIDYDKKGVSKIDRIKDTLSGIKKSRKNIKDKQKDKLTKESTMLRLYESCEAGFITKEDRDMYIDILKTFEE